MGEIISWFQNNWVELAAVIVLVEKLITAIAELTPWKWDDNLARLLTKVIKGVIAPLMPTKKG